MAAKPKPKKKTPKRIFAENMSTTFMHIIAGRLIKAMQREIKKMQKEIEDVSNETKIYQKKKKKS